MSQSTYIARKNEDADFADLTCDSLVVNSTTIDAGAITLADGEKITIGTGSDVTVHWDSTNLILTAAADDSLIEVGDSAATQKSFDVKLYGNAANGADYLYFDASANQLYTTGVDVIVKDADLVAFGSSSDVTITWDSTNLIIAAAADDSVIEIGDSAETQKSFDVKVYGNAASGADYLYFDASANLVYTTGVDLQFKDDDVLAFGTGAGAAGDVSFTFDSTDLVMAAAGASVDWTIGAASHVINPTITGTLTVGVDNTGYDVTFYGATTGCKMVWDESEDQLVLTGPADEPALVINGAGSKSAVAYAAAGTAWADAGTPAFVEDQMYMMVDIGGTVYRIPLWANA